MASPCASYESALTPEKVPTPPASAQAPEDSPLETEMPLPPSTSGNTSRPDIRMVFNAFNVLLPPASGRVPGSIIAPWLDRGYPLGPVDNGAPFLLSQILQQMP